MRCVVFICDSDRKVGSGHSIGKPHIGLTKLSRASEIALLNPYEATHLSDTRQKPIATRGLRTYAYAIIVGSSMSLVAPLCNATFCKIVLDFPFLQTLRTLLYEMTPSAFFLTAFALVVSFFVPHKVSQFLSSGQQEIPGLVITILFSLYFGLLGFGYVNGEIAILYRTFTYYELAPATIVGVGTLLHIIVRPKQMHGASSG